MGNRRLIRWGLGLCAFALLAPLTPAQQSPNGSGDGTLTAHQLKLKARAIAATQRFMDSIGRYSQAYGVEAELIMAVITVESDGDPNSISSAGAMGLMQLMPETCTDYGVQQPFDPDSNIRGGTAMLANHFRRYNGDVQKVLAAYNAGIRHADNGSWVNIPETRRYVPTVISIYEALKGSGDLPAFKDTTQIPTLPPEKNIDATPIIPAADLMLQALRYAPNVSDPAGLVEDGRLEDAASLVLTDYLSGRLSTANLQHRALHAANAVHARVKDLHAFYFTTASEQGFSDMWNQQAKIQGTYLGLAHSKTAEGHVWVILVSGS